MPGEVVAEDRRRAACVRRGGPDDGRAIEADAGYLLPRREIGGDRLHRVGAEIQHRDPRALREGEPVLREGEDRAAAERVVERQALRRNRH